MLRLLIALGLLGMGLSIVAQTKVDLQNQTRGVDFSAAQYTKPAKTGTSLPPTCSVGEAFILTTAPAGVNFFICLATNTWTLQGVVDHAQLQHLDYASSGHTGFQPALGFTPINAATLGAPNGTAQLGPDGKVLASQLPAQQQSATQTSQLLDWKITRLSSSSIQFGTVCLPGNPCNIDIGGTVMQYIDGPYQVNTVTANSGSVCIYISPVGQLTAGVGNGLTTADITASAPVAVVGGVDSCPQDAMKLGRWDVSAGSFVTTGSSYSSYLSYKPSPLSGTGISIVTGQRDTIQIDSTTVVRKYAVSGAPANVPGSARGDIAYDTTQTPYAFYTCQQPTCTQASHWSQLNGLGLESPAGNIVGTRPILQILNGTYVTCALNDTGSMLTQQCDADTTKLVDRTQSNTWGLGSRQTFQASSTTEAIRIVPSALPSAPQAGAIHVLSGDNSLNVFDGTAWNKAVTATGTLTSGAPLVGAGTNKIATASTTGSGSTFVLNQSPTLILPVISTATGGFTNAQHSHADAANGGALAASAVSGVLTGTCNSSTVVYGDLTCRTATSGSGLADPGANGILKRTALNITAVAAGADLPTHGSRHQNGGDDEISTATPAANAIPKAGASGQLAAGWIPDLSGTYSVKTAGGDLSGSLPSPVVAKVNGVAYGATPSVNTVPVVTATNTVTYQAVPNSALANSSVTVAAGTGMSGGGAVALGGTITLNNAGVLSVGGTAGQVNASTTGGVVTLSLPATISSNTSGNAATASALAAVPGQCGANQFATGVGVSGAANCAQVGYGQISGVPSNFNPAAHGATHGQAGSDPISIAATQVGSGQVAVARGGTGADLSGTGGSGQYLKQTSVGGAVTVAAIATSDLPAVVARTDQGNTYTAGIQNFSGATGTLPFQVGTQANLPTTCTQGQHYFVSDAAPAAANGARLYSCSTTNTWTAVGYGRGTLANRPTACAAGDIYFASDASAGQNLYYCTAANTWTQQVSGGAMAIGTAVTSGTSGSVMYVDGSGKLAQDNGNLFYNATTKRLSVGSSAITSPPLESVSTSQSGILFTNTSANSSARNWAIVTNYSAFGDFFLYQGTSQGASALGGSARLGISPSGNVLVGTTTDNGSDQLQVTGSTRSARFQANRLSIPIPTVTAQGTTGAATWGYKVMAVAADGSLSGAPYSQAQITNGNSTLNSTNFNQITWAAVPGAVSYNVYRTQQGGSPNTTGKIANTTGLSFNDTGIATIGSTDPLINYTGTVSFSVNSGAQYDSLLTWNGAEVRNGGSLFGALMYDTNTGADVSIVGYGGKKYVGMPANGFLCFSGTANSSVTSTGQCLSTVSGQNNGVTYVNDGSGTATTNMRDFAARGMGFQLANATSPGTTINLLAKLTGAPSTAVVTSTTDTTGAIGIVIAGAGTTGTATIAANGIASCVFDGATTAGDYVQISSTTAGNCHDAGNSVPATGQIIGRVLSSNAAGGTYQVLINLQR